jgi:hypothetical protein
MAALPRETSQIFEYLAIDRLASVISAIADREGSWAAQAS